MTDAEFRDAALARLDAMLVDLRRTKVGLFGAAGSPGPNWSMALRAHRDARELITQIAREQTPPPPPPANVAPRTYNLGTNDSDPRFCVAGLSRNASGRLADDFSEYDDDGRSLGGRDRNRMVPGLKVANEMDHRGPCDPYTKDGRSFPPWPAESYLR